MKGLVAFLILAVAAPAFARGGGGGHSSGGSHSIRGYERRNGTFVAPSHATNPDHSKLNNWSSKGNVNPYTGKAGTKDPFAPNRSH